MSKPLLLSSGSGKVQEFVGTATGQVPTWSDTAQTWVAGPGSNSGGGGRIYYLNEGTTADTPVTNLPNIASGAAADPKQLGTLADAAQTTVATTTMSTNPNTPTILAGFVTDTGDPDRTSVPAGLWEFNVWAAASGPSIKPDEVLFRVGVYKYDDDPGTLTLIANSDYVGIYNTTVTGQYTATVLIPAGVTLADTDRIYVQIDTYSTNANHDLTCYFGNGTPAHVHTTIPVLVNLATDVEGILPVANGGTGVTTLTGYIKGAGTAPMTASATIPVADVTGAAPIASPTFTGTVTIPAGASISGFAPLASPTFSGTPSLPTGTTGFTQSTGNNTTALATTAFVTTAVATSSGAPYDLPFEIPGTPASSTKVVNFKTVRAFALAATGHQGGQLTAPSGNFVCTVMKNGASIGTITFGTSSFSSSVTATSLAAGDVLSVETPAAALGIDTPFATLAMTLA